MAPKKGKSAKDCGASPKKDGKSPKKDGKNLTNKEITSMVKAMAPKARNPYALYMQEQQPTQRERLKLQGLTGPALQRAVVAAVSAGWRALPEAEKELLATKSKDERTRRQEALSELQASWPESSSSKPRKAEPTAAKTILGDYILEDEVVWLGSASWAVKAHHMKTLSSAQVINFELGDRDALARELQVLREIEGQEDPSFCDEVYLRILQATTPNAPSPALICENLPRVDEILKQDGAFALPLLRCAAQQLGLALCQLHELKVAHGDVKPAAVFFSREQNLFKLGRFSLSVDLPQQEPLDMMRYTAGFRAPELWVPLEHARVSVYSEAWAFAITLIEMYTAKHPFENLKEVHKADLSNMSELPDFLKGLLLPCLRHVPEQRMTVQELMTQGLALKLPVAVEEANSAEAQAACGNII